MSEHKFFGNERVRIEAKHWRAGDLSGAGIVLTLHKYDGTTLKANVLAPIPIMAGAVATDVYLQKCAEALTSDAKDNIDRFAAMLELLGHISGYRPRVYWSFEDVDAGTKLLDAWHEEVIQIEQAAVELKKVRVVQAQEYLEKFRTSYQG